MKIKVEKEKKKNVLKDKEPDQKKKGSERTENRPAAKPGVQKVNCKTMSIETDQEFEKRGSGKEAREVPVWKQTREVVCDLKQKVTEAKGDNVLVNRKVFITLLDKSAECLDLMFPSEEEDLNEMDKNGNENRKERLIRVFGPFMKQFFQLSNGVYEAKTEKPLCSPSGMNPYHDADGEFSTKADAKSWSVRQGYHKKGCRKGQRSANPSRWTTTVCGRKNRLDPNVKAPNKCKKTDEQIIQEVYDRWTELVEHQN